MDRSIKIPPKTFYGAIAVMLGLQTYSPVHDYVASKLPVRGEQAAVAAVGRNEADNHLILQKLSNIVTVSEKLDTLSEKVSTMDQHLQHLEDRVDRLFDDRRIPMGPGQ